MKELMLNVAMGSKDENTLISLANRLIRLNSQMSQKERNDFADNVRASAGNIAQHLLDAFDIDVQAQRAGIVLDSDLEPTEEQKVCLEQTKNEMIKTAVEPFYNPEVRNYIENVRRSHDQIIDNVNIDEVVKALNKGFLSSSSGT